MEMALQVRAILATRSLTLYNVSRRSAELFGRSSPFFLPHNLYYDLAHAHATPTISQILALSHITDYRFFDWLAVFGFELDAISQLQLRVPRRRTTLLDPTVYDPQAWIPWFREQAETAAASSTAPLGHLLAVAPPERATDLLALNKKRFLYAMVGEQDLYAGPYFVPGSIVRVDTRHGQTFPVDRDTHGERSFFLVEYEFGWTCARLAQLGKDRVLLLCPQRPCAERELRVGKDARILGVLDAEIRRLTCDHASRPKLSKTAASAKRRLERSSGEETNLKDLLRHSRARVGLSFRDASSISRWIADTLSDELYFAAASTLSDFEALSGPPRHVQKIITLCLLYSIGFEQFLRAAGLPLGRAGREPVPDEFVRRPLAIRHHTLIPTRAGAAQPGGFLAALLNEWEEIPLFLRFSIDEITGLKNFSPSSVFWVGGDQAQQHPLLARSAFIAVNRRARKPPAHTENAVCQQALFLVLKRDGRYLCGRCTLDSGTLTIHGYPGSVVRSKQLRNGSEAEVIGQVTAILRRLV